MRIGFIKFVDKFIGTVLVFIFSHLVRLRLKIASHRRKPNRYNPSILIVKFWGMGNIILLLPAIRAIRESFPQSKILFLTLTRNKGLIEASFPPDEVLYLKLDSFFKLISDTIKLILKLRSRKIDLAFDFEEFARFSTIVIYLSGIADRIGFSPRGQYRGGLYTKDIPINESQHIVDNFVRLVRLEGIKVLDKDYLKVSYSQKDKEYIDSLLNGKVTASHYLVGLNVSCGPNALVRRWSPEKFAVLANRLIEELGAKILFVGTEDDKSVVNSVIEKMSHPTLNLVGLTDKRQLGCLIERCDLFISNDSGLAHFSQAMRVPTIVIFGPESPVKYGPRDKMHRVIYKGLPCSPCLSIRNMKTTHCRSPLCLEEMTPKEVFDVSQKFYEKSIVSR